MPPRDALPPSVAVSLRRTSRLPATHPGGQHYPATQNIILACRALGPGTLITTNHILYEDDVRAILGCRMTFSRLP